MKKDVKRKKLQSWIMLITIILFSINLLAACGVSETGGMGQRYNLDVVEHTSDFYVNDFANLFTESQKADLMAKAVNMDTEYSGIQVVITTVNSLEETVVGYGENKPGSFTIEEVAYSMYEQYGIGQDDMGILILFSVGDREVKIETGYHMQAYITDSVSGQLLDDYGMDYFVDNKFAEGLIAVQDATINEIKSKVPKDWNTPIASNQNEEKTPSDMVDKGIIGEVAQESNKSEKDIGGGFIGSCIAMVVAIGAFILQRIKGKERIKEAEEYKQLEIQVLKDSHAKEMASARENYQIECSELTKKFDAERQRYLNQISNLQSSMEEKESELNFVKLKLSVITDKFERAQRLHPELNFEQEIQEMMINEFKAEAGEIDKWLQEVLNKPASKDNIEIFRSAIGIYDDTKAEVKKYLATEREALVELCATSVLLKQEYDRAEQEKRDKALAQKAYENIKGVLGTNQEANHETYKVLDRALEGYLSLSHAQKLFFPDNALIETLKQVHSLAKRDYQNFETAKEAENHINYIIGNIYSADEHDQSRLRRAMGYYRTLTIEQQAYFSEDLLRKLKKLIRQADDDHEAQERRRAEERRREEERRRAEARRSYSSSSFSSRSSGGFSGRGGRPSGGGASRKF